MQYLVGHGINPHDVPVWVGYQPKAAVAPNSELIAVVVGAGPRGVSDEKEPKAMLEFAPGEDVWETVQGQKQFKGWTREIGWFKNRCRDARCEWFEPMVKRMAAGEHVSLEEIQAAYALHNGKPMPCGEWRSMFQ